MSTVLDKHNLIINALEVKPDWTLALEELTGPSKTTEELHVAQQTS